VHIVTAGHHGGKSHPSLDATEQALSPTPASIKRETLAGLYRAAPRVGVWAGAAHGVLQAFQQPPAAPKLPLPLDG